MCAAFHEMDDWAKGMIGFVIVAWSSILEAFYIYKAAEYDMVYIQPDNNKGIG